jgi:TolB-like protein/Flp pilus assembly protein TadD
LSFFQELKRRHVFRAAIAYLALAWLLIEVAGTLFPGFGIPDWAFRFVVTLLALGFVPVLIFSWAYEMTPEGIKREQDVVRDDAGTQRTARRLDWLTIGLIVVALGFIAVDRLWLASRVAGPTETAGETALAQDQTIAASRYGPPDSIAVLPFANRSANPEDAFFVDGIHDDLLTYVSQIGALKVISRTSVMEYRDTLKKIPQIARELDVGHVLEGGVQRAGDQVRINVQLIDARTDDHLWSQIYDRQLTAANVFAIQSEIAGAIAEALRAELTPQTRERFDRIPTENLEALEAYFLGRQKMATRVVADLAAAVDHYETAISLDPGFALARANLACASALYTGYAGLSGQERQAWLDRGRAAAERALQLDPGLAEAHTAAGVIDWYERNFESAEAAFQRAIQLNQNDERAHQWYGAMLGRSMGRVEEALEYSRRAVTLDPKSAIIRTDYGDVLNRAERFDEALEQFQRAVEIEPRFSKGYRRIGTHAIRIGRLDQAISAYHKAQAIEPDNWQMSRSLGAIYLGLGDDRQAEYWFRLALEQSPLGLALMGADLGRLYLYRGDEERAMEYFDAVLPGSQEHQFALFHQVNHDLKAGQFAAAMARYQQVFPDLFEDAPAVDQGNHVAALQLAAVYAWAGEVERMERLLDLVVPEVDAFEPRHYEDEAAIHALRGDHQAALDALSRLEAWTKIQGWREIVVGHPAFRSLLANPDFQALNEAFEAEMARQRARVRALEESGELTPAPNR